MADSRTAAPSTVTEIRLSAYRSLRARTVPLGPVTLLTGPSGSGKSTVLEAYEALARLCGGEALGEVFGGARGGPSALIPQGARGDRDGRRGFRLGCTVDGPAGPVRLDVSVQAEPELRVVGERLSGPDGTALLCTALRDPRSRTVQAEWCTSAAGRMRGPFPDDRLGTTLLPLRISGSTPEQCRLLAAAEQVVVALRAVFFCDPRAETMRDPVAAGDGQLRGGCDNVAAVLRRTRVECGIRHGLLIEALRAGWADEVLELVTDVSDDGPDRGLVRTVVERGGGRRTPMEWLGDGELRYAALALVLLTGPGVLATNVAEEVLPARQSLAILADGLDRGLDRRQTTALLTLAGRMGERGHVRLLGAVSDGGAAAAAGTEGVAQVPGVALVDLGR